MVKLLGHLGGKLNRNLVTGKDSRNQPPRYVLQGRFVSLVQSPGGCSKSTETRLMTYAVFVDHRPLLWLLVVSSEEMMKKFVAWDSEKRLSFAVPFSDMKPVIYLDPFLPRISELALSSSDRQTKVRHLTSESFHRQSGSSQNLFDSNFWQRLTHHPVETREYYNPACLVFDAGSSL